MRIDFVTCPRCQCRNWNDVPKLSNLDRTSFKCNRCGYLIVLGSCGRCKTENAWSLVVGIQEKGAHRPMYRFQCRGCRRMIGILLQPK